MSEYSDYDESSDENARELTVEADCAINKALAKTVTGEALKNEKISIDSEFVESHNEEDKSKLLNESAEALKAIASADPKDDTDAFLRDYFSRRKWEEKQKKPSADELKADDDLDEIDEGLEFEERYNFRHEEKDFDIIPSNPRFVEGEDRVKESNRHKKRREAAEKSKELEEQYKKRLDEIDEKYKKIAEENGGRLSKEQLHQYTNECADVLLEEQEGVFNYSEVKTDGGIEKSIRILDDENDEEESLYEPDNDGKEKSSKPNKNVNKERDQIRSKHPAVNKRNKFNQKRNGKFGKSHKNRYKGITASRMSTYESHKH